MKRTHNSTSEYGNFENVLKTVLSVPHSEIQRRLEAEKRSKPKKKKRVKTSPSSRASGDKD
jgi:hypothetical protein